MSQPSLFSTTAWTYGGYENPDLVSKTIQTECRFSEIIQGANCTTNTDDTISYSIQYGREDRYDSCRKTYSQTWKKGQCILTALDMLSLVFKHQLHECWIRAKHPPSYHLTVSERSWELNNRESHDCASQTKNSETSQSRWDRPKLWLAYEQEVTNV